MEHSVVDQKIGRLETINGKYARIELNGRRRTMYRIVAKRDQGTESKVTFYQCCGNDDNVCVTFSFEVENKEYFPVAKRQRNSKIPTPVEVTPLKKPLQGSLDEKFLFRWAGAKEHFQCLKSVTEPSQFLLVHNNQFTLSSKSGTPFKVN